MRFTFVIVSILLTYTACYCQTRIFISGGGSFLTTYEPNDFFSPSIGNAVWKTDGSYNTKQFTKQLTFDIEAERRLGKFFVVSGVRYFHTGYNNAYQTNFSSFQATHIGVPLMFRLNFENFLYLDLGVIGTTTVKANLQETALKGSAYELTDAKDIHSYLSPFNLGLDLQYTIVINRFLISAYFIKMRTEVKSSLENDWNINGRYRNNSLFLRDMSPHYRYYLFGVKLGVRIR